MPATIAISERSKTWPVLSHGGGQARFPLASVCPQGIGRWYWHSGGRQFVCGGQAAAQALVWEVFIRSDADEVYFFLQGDSVSLIANLYPALSLWHVNYMLERQSVLLFYNWGCMCYTPFNLHCFRFLAPPQFFPLLRHFSAK